MVVNIIVENEGCNDLSSPLKKFLYEQDLLQDETNIKKSLEEVKKLLTNDLLLTIMPTERCNFKCTYCYESKNNIDMTRDMLLHIYNYITKQVPTSKNVDINWFGGEPTLCKSFILEMSSRIQKLQEVYNFKYSASMTTNGYLLDIESFYQYYEAGITKYQITLDGWNHDFTRPYISGIGTSDTILKNLKKISLLPKNYKFNIIIRYNILNETPDYTWYNFLNETFGTDDRFTVMVAAVNDWGGETVKSLNLLEKDNKKEVKKLHEDYLDKIGMSRVGKTKWPLSDVCYASFERGFIFRANGDIEKCSISLDHPKNKVGTINPEKGVLLNEDNCKLWSTNDLKMECFTCEDILSCLNIACKKRIIVDGKTENLRICQL